MIHHTTEFSLVVSKLNFKWQHKLILVSCSHASRLWQAVLLMSKFVLKEGKGGMQQISVPRQIRMHAELEVGVEGVT